MKVCLFLKIIDSHSVVLNLLIFPLLSTSTTPDQEVNRQKKVLPLNKLLNDLPLAQYYFLLLFLFKCYLNLTSSKFILFSWSWLIRMGSGSIGILCFYFMGFFFWEYLALSVYSITFHIINFISFVLISDIYWSFYVILD